MPKHAFLALAFLLLPFLLGCESNASPFRDSPEDRLAAVRAAELAIEQGESAQSDAATTQESGDEAATDDASAEQSAGVGANSASDEDTDTAEDPSSGLEPPTELTAFLRLRFPQHDDFQTIDVWIPDTGDGATPNDTTIVLAYSSGTDPLSGHVAGIYEVAENRVATRADITFDPSGGLSLARIEQLFRSDGGRILGSPWGSDLWFLREGALGAHGSGTDLLRWDPSAAGPSAFTIELSWSSAIPGTTAQLVDFDADGVPELRLDDTDAYVFCYACGVREVGFQVARWNGANLVMAPLAPLDSGALGVARSAVDFAIDLAGANLWQDAMDVIDLAARLEPGDPVIEWNAILIRQHAAEREAAAGDVYPLLTHLYAGQFAEAVASLRPILPIDLLDLYGPVTAGTPADGWESVVVATLIRSTDDALALRPDLAPALFLRGLAHFWLSPDQPEAAITDINAAVAIDPSEPLYEAVANLLTP